MKENKSKQQTGKMNLTYQQELNNCWMIFLQPILS